MQTLNSHFFGCKNLVDYFKNKNLKLFIQIGSSLEYGKKNHLILSLQNAFPTLIMESLNLGLQNIF